MHIMMKLFTKAIDISHISHSIVLQSLPFLTVLINLQSMYITFAELLLRPNTVPSSVMACFVQCKSYIGDCFIA